MDEEDKDRVIEVVVMPLLFRMLANLIIENIEEG